MANKKLTLIFDMDGTLYKLKGGSFVASGIYDEMIKNTVNYLASKLDINYKQAEAKLKDIRTRHGNSISIGIEQELGFDRYEYFKVGWNINPEGHVEVADDINKLINTLSKKYKLVILSDAPRVWIERVLRYLNIAEYFGDNIFSGEGNIRKSFGNAHPYILEKLQLQPEECIVVGDEEANDILPAKQVGMRTVFIGDHTSEIADDTIANILELKDLKIS